MSTLSHEQLLDTLQWRYATKKYDPERKIPEATWRTLEDALLLAPSSYGLQPWKALVIKNSGVRAKLRPVAWGQSQVTDASHLVVFAAMKNITAEYIDSYIQRIADVRSIPADALKDYRNMMVGDIVNGPRSSWAQAWAQRQAYIGLGLLLESAAFLGIDATPMEGFDPAKFDEILGLPAKGLAATVMCALGYRAADDTYAKYAKVRWAKEDVILHV
ncbi:MAG TPA: NAD(P)H-dependent oxidoreductase [Phycisphaerae bacterium]|nr:NAD(P)H-dependent oxidoreductase [Phycisphaerae bacterium]